MNLSEIDKLPPKMRAQALVDQERASAARSRIMAQLKHAEGRWTNLAAMEAHDEQLANMFAPPAKSPEKAISAPARGIPKGPKVSETHIQQETVRWWREHCHEWQLEPELLFAIPNQARRSRANAGRMLAEGLLSGVPDVLVAVPRGDCGGFWIEFKSRDGVLSENQRLMLARLTKIGYATVVVRSVIEATSAITAYLNLPTKSK